MSLVALAVAMLTPAAPIAEPAETFPRSASSTSYCLRGRMADGAYTHPGAAASNRHPLGTRILLARPAMGRRRWTIRDRIGHGSDLDLWASSCSTSIAYGRRPVRYRIAHR